MGQGQEIIARNYLAAATTDGQWLLLQNTHLGLAYLSEVSTSPIIKTGQYSTRCAAASMNSHVMCEHCHAVVPLKPGAL